MSGIYSYYKDKGMEDECEQIIRFSPVAWQHINLIGMYEFNKGAESLDLQGIIESLISNSKINLSSVS